MRSLQLKIALSLALLAGLATMSVGLSSYQSARSRLIDEVDRSLVQAAGVVVVRNERTGPGGRERIIIERLVLPRGSTLDTFAIALLDPDGDVVRSNSSLELPVDPLDQQLAGNLAGSRFRTVAIDEVPYRLHTVSVASGALQVARPLTGTYDVLDDLRRRTIWQVVLISVAAALTGLLIARSVSRPLVRLTMAAERVGATGELDVTVEEAGRDEVGRLTTAFHHMLTALARSRTEQQRLVQNAGHELRTPLTSLRTNLDVLRRHQDLDAATRARLLEDLARDTEELVVLVNEVIEVASGERDESPPRPVELGALVRRCAERAERRSGRRVMLAVEESWVLGRPEALDRAVSNLLDNAAKFDPSDAPIEVSSSGGRVEVCDRGPGIPEEDLPHVFERFHRSVEARALPGSGLGLAIVRDVVERHGGRVVVSNRDGGGACVGFALPVVLPPPGTLT